MLARPVSGSKLRVLLSTVRNNRGRLGEPGARARAKPSSG